MSDNRSVLLTVEGRSFDGIDLDGLASGNHLLRVDLGELAGLAAVIDSAADRSDIFYVGTGNLDFDARAAAAIGVPLLIAYDRSGPHVERAIRQATDLGAVVAEACDGHRLAWAVGPALEVEAPQVMSQAVFEHRLLNKAKRIGAHIVLPEGEDSRILRAAHRLLADDIARLTILGNPDQINVRAEELGLDLSKADILNHHTSDLAERFARTFVELRKKKGVTLDQARETMKDVSYFATMMVHEGIADGMVSGAVNTTAHTIKPALQIIKTTPEASVVSSIFLMVFEGHHWAFGDCAVNINPTAEQLGEIAVVSARTASQFDIDPRVAMLSYSSGTSASGPEVDRTTTAVEKARELNPGLLVDGPLQFDAAVDPGVAAKKMPDSDVAGRATVFVFPDLESGNIGYKAVQRTADALAVGPILQGLKKPVNDLSRGATVPDIVNTVAVTAVQAGEGK